MASEAVLKELFEVAKASNQFKGMSDEEIQKACIAYKDRSDENIRTAMSNIQEKDQNEAVESEDQQAKIEQNKEKMVVMHQQEAVDHKKDEQDAEKILEGLFNS